MSYVEYRQSSTWKVGVNGPQIGRQDRRGSLGGRLLLLLGGRLFERHKLLGAEGFIVDLRGRFDQVLQVRPTPVSP